MNVPPRLLNNTVLKLGALVFALFLWFYVDAQQNPFVTQMVETVVDYQNLEDSLSLNDAPKTVDVKVSGRKETISTLRADDIKAVVDMEQVTIGDHELTVQTAGPKDITIISVSPAKIKINVDRMTEISLDVQAAVVGNVAEGYTKFAPSITPSTVQIKGAESVLNTIKTARVEVDLTDAAGNLVLNLPVKLLTKDGRVVDNKGVEVVPQTVEVFLPVDQNTPSKTVPIKPILTGEPASGYVLSRVITEPATVKLVGSYEQLKGIDQVQTTPIYIANLTDDIIQEVELKIPSGITVMNGNKVKVMVNVEPNPVNPVSPANPVNKNHQDVPLAVDIRGLAEKRTAKLAFTNVTVTLEGAEQTLSDPTKLAGVVPYVDLTGLAAGSHTVAVGVSNTSGLHMVQVQPASIQVEISEKTAP